MICLSEKEMVIAIIIILVLLLAAIGFLIWGFRYACARGKGAHITDIESGYSLSKYDDIIKAGIQWTRNKGGSFVTIESFDGLRLSARYIENTESDVVMVLFHGYRSIAENDFSVAVRNYYEMGYSVLLCDQRAHGRSEGKYITYGVRERFDCVSWCRYAVEALGKKRIILGGMSMGTTTVLMAASCGLPENVVGITADCGFTSPAEIISEFIKGMKLPPKLIMPILNICFKRIAGFDAYSCSTCDSMRENTDIPVLFIHGEADGFVPCEMTLRAYDACNSKKWLVTVTDADHGLSYLVDRERVDKALCDFFAEVLQEEKKGA